MISLKDIKTLQTLDNGVYWFFGTNEIIMPVDFQKDGTNASIYFLGSEMAAWLPDDAEEGEFLHPVKLVFLDKAETLLKCLLKHFDVINGHLQWHYIEGTTLPELEDISFEKELLPYLDKEKNSEYISCYIED